MSLYQKEDGVVFVFSVGICTASVCAPKDMGKAEVERRVRKLDPTGAELTVRAERRAAGRCRCVVNDGRMHWLLSC